MLSLDLLNSNMIYIKKFKTIDTDCYCIKDLLKFQTNKRLFLILSFIARKNWNVLFIMYDILIVNYFSLTQKELQYPLVLGHPKRLIQHTVRRYYLGVYVVCVCREKKIMQSFQNHSHSVYVVGALTFLKVWEI